MGISWWYTLDCAKLNISTYLEEEVALELKVTLWDQSSFQMKPQKMQCGLAKACSVEDRVEPTSQVIVLVSTNVVWRLNSQTENTRSDEKKLK